MRLRFKIAINSHSDLRRGTNKWPTNLNWHLVKSKTVEMFTQGVHCSRGNLRTNRGDRLFHTGKTMFATQKTVSRRTTTALASRNYVKILQLRLWILSQKFRSWGWCQPVPTRSDKGEFRPLISQRVVPLNCKSSKSSQRLVKNLSRRNPLMVA